MRPPLRIAILEADTPLKGTQAKYGGYGGVFEVLLKAGADHLQQPDVISSKHGLEFSCFDVVDKQEYPKLEDIDAVLITGSRHDSFASTPWILNLVTFTTQLLNQSRIRIIGVCFGHQILGRALGSMPGRSDKGWETSVSLVKLTVKGSELFEGKDLLSLHQMHKDVVFEYPGFAPSLPDNGNTNDDSSGGDGDHGKRDEDAKAASRIEPLGHSPACEVQGMYCRNRLISVQGHPEFNREIVTELLEARHQQGVFGDEMYRDGMGRVGNAHDGVVVAAGFLRFLLEE